MKTSNYLCDVAHNRRNVTVIAGLLSWGIWILCSVEYTLMKAIVVFFLNINSYDTYQHTSHFCLYLGIALRWETGVVQGSVRGMFVSTELPGNDVSEGKTKPNTLPFIAF